ncbi:MAG: NAD(+) synthase [Oscillospiraceae bacterium]
MVFSGHSLIYENGQLLAEKKPFAKNGLIATEIDLFRLRFERHRNTSFDESSAPECRRVYFSQELRDTELTRHIARRPFVPADGEILAERAEAILSIQSDGLMRRIEHTGCCKAVIGISGGLDCTACAAGYGQGDGSCLEDRGSDIVAVTDALLRHDRTDAINAEKLCEELDVSFKMVDIRAAVNQHFADIGHDEGCTDVTYENWQARERTQVLMDIANQNGGLVVGTGDLSELALGWATYNGDHMSMYGVNASVPQDACAVYYRIRNGRCGGGAVGCLKIYSTRRSPRSCCPRTMGASRRKRRTS